MKNPILTTKNLIYTEKEHSYKKIYTTSLSGENRDIDQRSQ